METEVDFIADRHFTRQRYAGISDVNTRTEYCIIYEYYVYKYLK